MVGELTPCRKRCLQDLLALGGQEPLSILFMLSSPIWKEFTIGAPIKFEWTLKECWLLAHVCSWILVFAY